jgi:hypothetical protein
MDDFLNPNFKGIDFGEEVDYSHFQSTRIWYISLSTILSKQKMKKIIKDSSIDKMASL